MWENFLSSVGLSQDGIVANILEAFIITVIFIASLIILRKLIRVIYQRLEGKLGLNIRGLHFQNQEMISAEDLQRYSKNIIRYSTLLLYIPISYFYIIKIFHIFPITKDYSTQLIQMVVDATKTVGISIIEYIPNVIILVILYFICKATLKIMGHFFSGIENKKIFINGFYPEWADPTKKIAKLFVIIFFLVIAFPYLPGSGSPAFQGLSIFMGVIISIGSSRAITNIISGIVLTYMRAFTIGDRVKIAETEGDVIEKSLFVTRIRTVKNVGIAIPNSSVLSNHIVNYSNQAKKRGLILNISLTLGYDIPWQKIHELLLLAVNDIDGVEKTPVPFVLQKALNDFYVEYEVNAYTHEPERMNSLYSDMNQRILDVFDAAGIEIASPHLRLLKAESIENLPTNN